MGRRNPKLDAIYDVFDKLGVEIDQDAIWEVQGTPVVKHKDVERLGAALRIEWEKPQILRSEADEAVIIVFGKVDGKMEWSIGEAKIVHMVDTGKTNKWGKPVKAPKEGAIGNYQIAGQASYPYAMAEKRGKDRVILKLANLHGLYSEEEADDFSQRKSVEADEPADRKTSSGTNDNAAKPSVLDEIFDELDKQTDTQGVMDLLKSKPVQDKKKKLSSDQQEQVRKYANKRLQVLGWKSPAEHQKEAEASA